MINVCTQVSEQSRPHMTFENLLGNPHRPFQARDSSMTIRVNATSLVQSELVIYWDDVKLVPSVLPDGRWVGCGGGHLVTGDMQCLLELVRLPLGQHRLEGALRSEAKAELPGRWRWDFNVVSAGTISMQEWLEQEYRRRRRVLRLVCQFF